MKSYIYLVVSIIWEVFGTTMLKMAEGFTVLPPSIGAIVGYVLSFFFLGLALKSIPLSVAYAVWAGAGTVLTTLVSVVLWGEALGVLKIIGLLIIISGVIVLNMTESKKIETVPSK